jgi:hypothetical protein
MSVPVPTCPAPRGPQGHDRERPRPETPRELQAAFAELVEAVTPLAGGHDPDTLTEVAWSALHGIATLTRARRLRPDYHQARLTMLVDQLAGVPG